MLMGTGGGVMAQGLAQAGLKDPAGQDMQRGVGLRKSMCKLSVSAQSGVAKGEGDFHNPF